jgi:adenine deaminase
MKQISGNIFNISTGIFIKGTLYFNDKIIKIEENLSIQEDQFIIPGLIDSHIHIESSMLTPLEYSKVALRHGVIGAITDPHEIANVCGIDGVDFMIKNSNKTPMKIYTGAPSCVPATPFETSGATIESNDIKILFKEFKCSHLSEMMNFAGVLNGQEEVLNKIKIAQSYNKVIDGHAPLLKGKQLEKYISTGISTEHESISLIEAKEKISKGMKVFIRESTATHGFEKMHELISDHADSTMFCTDDCHPYDLENHYIDELFKRSLKKGHSIENIIKVSSINAIKHYNLDIGILRINDNADFIVINNFDEFSVRNVFIEGEEVFNGEKLSFDTVDDNSINKFFINKVGLNDIKVRKISNSINVIEAFEDSLITKKITYIEEKNSDYWEPSIENDILKIVIVNRYTKGTPSVGFIKGFNIKEGAIGSSIAHDSHNLIVIGTNDFHICKVIDLLQESLGGIAYSNSNSYELLPLQIAGLMSVNSAEVINAKYSLFNNIICQMGCLMKNPYITLSFMSLLVIPEIKIGDKGLFDVNKFKFIDIQC